MIYKLTNIKPVIAKIVRDLGLGAEEIPYQDFMEWIFDGLQHIGSYYQFEERECEITISDYKGKLPCDFHKMIRIKAKIVLASTPTISNIISDNIQVIRNKITNFQTLLETETDLIKIETYTDAIANLNTQLVAEIGKINADTTVLDSSTNSIIPNNNLIGTSKNNRHTPADYNINFDNITTAFKDGTIIIQYLSIPVDEEGFPLIPDDISYRDALFWKVAYQLSLRGFEFKAKQLNDINFTRNKWNFYCIQSRANANMPDLEMMETLKNQFIKLKPNYHEYFNNFSTLGKGQYIALSGKK